MLILRRRDANEDGLCLKSTVYADRARVIPGDCGVMAQQHGSAASSGELNCPVVQRVG
jgi:hypothetical protein